MEIRSYRRVFDLERRIYRVDRLRLNPGGIPVRGVVYFLAILAAELILGRLPLAVTLMRTLPWYLVYLALPGTVSALLTVIRIEGRPFHLAAVALVRYRSRARCLAGLRECRSRACSVPGARWWPGPMLLVPDGSDSRMRRLRYVGPGAVLVAVAHDRELAAASLLDRLRRRTQLTLSERPDEPIPETGEVIVLEQAAQLRVR
jgi:hypothetical protein